MAGADLFFTARACEFGTPDLFLAFLVRDELLQRGKRDEPEPVDDAALDEAATGKTGDVIRCELHDARGVARAQVSDAVDGD